MNYIAISPDSKFAISYQMHDHPVVWDIATEKEMVVLYDEKIEYASRDFVFGPDTNQIITAHSDENIYLWSAVHNPNSRYNSQII